MDPGMVAERTVQQLRLELGVKFQELDSNHANLQILLSKLQKTQEEMEEGFESLQDNVTNAFKHNNGLLRTEMKALVGDIGQKNEENLNKIKEENAATIEELLKKHNESIKKQHDILEKNINDSLKNIQENGINKTNKERNDMDWERKKSGNKYGFNKEYKLAEKELWADNTSTGFMQWKIKVER